MLRAPFGVWLCPKTVFVCKGDVQRLSAGCSTHIGLICMGWCEAQTSHMPLFSECKIYFQLLGVKEGKRRILHVLLLFLCYILVFAFFVCVCLFSFDISTAFLIVSLFKIQDCLLKFCMRHHCPLNGWGAEERWVGFGPYNCRES